MNGQTRNRPMSNVPTDETLDLINVNAHLMENCNDDQKQTIKFQMSSRRTSLNDQHLMKWSALILSHDRNNSNPSLYFHIDCCCLVVKSLSARS